MRLYYLTGAQFALSNIALRRIKIARFEDLNDPFELLGVDLGVKEHRPAFRAMKKKLNDDQGLICFSKSWSNPLLWGHYAEKHTEVCMGFDIPDKKVAPVIYAKNLLRLKTDAKTNQPKLTKSVVNKLLRTKFFDWRYEEEFRFFVKLDHDTVESGKYFFEFSDDLVLREVILGPRCELRINGIRDIVAEMDPSVEVIKSRLAFSRFEVLRDKVESRHDSPRRWGQEPMDNKPWLSSLAFLAFYVNGALERGHGAQVSFQDVYRGIGSNSLFEDLDKKLPGVFDFSVFRHGDEQRAGVLEALKIASGGLEGRERRKVGIEKDGLSLLMAFILEAIQQGYWTKPPRFRNPKGR